MKLFLQKKSEKEKTIEIWQDFIFNRQERMKGTAECKRNRLDVKEI